MSDHDALLAAVCADPREDTPRLAYADWLEENGRAERAAFIRNDIAMSLRDEWDADRVAWEEELWRGLSFDLDGGTWGRAGFGPLPESLGWLGTPGTRRGFPWGIEVRRHRALLDAGDDLFARHPIGFVWFRDVPQAPARLAERPWFRRLSGLEFDSGRCSREAFLRLLTAPTELSELCFGSRATDPVRVGEAFASAVPAALNRLAVHGGPRVGRLVLEALEAWPQTNRLRTLELPQGVLGDGVAGVGDRLPAGVRSLDIRESRMNAERAEEFAARPGLAGLKRLRLGSNPVGNDGAAAIFTSPHLAGLKVLELSYCMVGDEALRALLERSPLADGLTRLYLGGSPASADMLQAVKHRMGDRLSL